MADEKIKPLDKIMHEQQEEFESGTEREVDKDLDKMIWELGDYENQEPPQETDEYAEPPQMEEELTEKGLRISQTGGPELREVITGDEKLTGGEVFPEATAITEETETNEGE